MIPNDNNVSILNLYIIDKAWWRSVRCDAKPSYYNKVPSDHTSSHNSTWILLYDNILAIQTRIWYPMIAIWAYWIISCPQLIAILNAIFFSQLLLTQSCPSPSTPLPSQLPAAHYSDSNNQLMIDCHLASLARPLMSDWRSAAPAHPRMIDHNYIVFLTAPLPTFCIARTNKNTFYFR
jgi:hypothetical protein